MEKTKIDWCDSSWNPVTGCFNGCQYCYARTIANRFAGWDHTLGDGEINMIKTGTSAFIAEVNDGLLKDGKKAPYPFGFLPTLHKHKLDEYVNKKRGRNVFVCSMADLFGDWVPDSWVDAVMEACKRGPQHNYLFLTKHPERYCRHGVKLADNMWYGTSILSADYADMYNYLPAFANTFVSIEPLLGDIKPKECTIMFRDVDWFIIGAETGNRKDKVIPERKWIEDIVNECRKYDKPVFMKSSLAPIWGEPLIQEFPQLLLDKRWKKKTKNMV